MAISPKREPGAGARGAAGRATPPRDAKGQRGEGTAYFLRVVRWVEKFFCFLIGQRGLALTPAAGAGVRDVHPLIRDMLILVAPLRSFTLAADATRLAKTLVQLIGRGSGSGFIANRDFVVGVRIRITTAGYNHSTTLSSRLTPGSKIWSPTLLRALRGPRPRRSAAPGGSDA